MKKLLLLLLLLPLPLIAGDPVPGIGITVEQSPPGLVKKGKTNAKGELVLSGFQPGTVTVAVTLKGKTTVIGKTRNDRIVIPGNAKAPIKPIRLELSSYSTRSTQSKKGYDHYQAKSDMQAAPKGEQPLVRKKPGKLAAAPVDSPQASGGTKAQDYNSSRSNRTLRAAGSLDSDDDGDSVLDRHDGMDNDCDGIIEITPMGGGKVLIRLTCEG